MKLMNLKLIIPVSKVYFCNILRFTGSKTPTTLTTKNKQTNQTSKKKQTKQTKQFVIRKKKGGGGVQGFHGDSESYHKNIHTFWYCLIWF